MIWFCVCVSHIYIYPLFMWKIMFMYSYVSSQKDVCANKMKNILRTVAPIPFSRAYMKLEFFFISMFVLKFHAHNMSMGTEKYNVPILDCFTENIFKMNCIVHFDLKIIGCRVVSVYVHV